MDSKDVEKPLPEKWVNIFDLIEQMGEINYSNYKIYLINVLTLLNIGN
jgi:hypothetical protein